MAIYHFGKVQIINRATGKGAVVSSAYISAEKYTMIMIISHMTILERQVWFIKK